MAAVLNVANLMLGDNSADYRGLPVIIGSNKCSVPLCSSNIGLANGIGDPILRELRANGTNDHPLWSLSLNNKTANHHVLTGLNKAAGADVTRLELAASDSNRTLRPEQLQVLVSPRTMAV
jgi:hypothetical protein